MKKLGYFLSCLLSFLIALFFETGVYMGAVLAYYKKDTIPLLKQKVIRPQAYLEIMRKPISTDLQLLFTIAAAATCLFIFGLSYRHILKKNEMLGAEKAFTIGKIISVVFLGIALQAGVTEAYTWVEHFKPDWFKSYEALMKTITEGNIIYVGILTVVVAPISEEFIFRGVILEKSKKVMPFIFANILQALLFGIMHMNPVQGVYAFVLGLFLGLVYMKCNTILAPMLLHMVFNLTSFILGIVFKDEKVLEQLLLKKEVAMGVAGGVSLILLITLIVICKGNKNAKAEVGNNYGYGNQSGANEKMSREEKKAAKQQAKERAKMEKESKIQQDKDSKIRAKEEKAAKIQYEKDLKKQQKEDKEAQKRYEKEAKKNQKAEKKPKKGKNADLEQMYSDRELYPNSYSDPYPDPDPYGDSESGSNRYSQTMEFKKYDKDRY